MRPHGVCAGSRPRRGGTWLPLRCVQEHGSATWHTPYKSSDGARRDPSGHARAVAPHRPRVERARNAQTQLPWQRYVPTRLESYTLEPPEVVTNPCAVAYCT
eukprot:scaffold4470_cov255-Prasinococcus_capsulatus_cf.AAC.36